MGAASRARTSATVVTVTAGKSGLSFSLSKSSVPHGAVTFKVKNAGVPALVQGLLERQGWHSQLLCRERHRDDLTRGLGHVEHHVREGGKLRVPVHRSRARRERDEGDPESHLTILKVTSGVSVCSSDRGDRT